ncbi:hypothetical protein B0H67DRAFT_553458 [Lasiosphaeris hirsuta]|uniref:J domain-containing protein n=1 Tax=Lasiosphaeris hirsuta TaxID=260670 RepID=A0AA40AFD1_9PEZI|nr:hypothetical protein B0H67DRAFT_553458 [Lasiosphaeris hirsuta]
MVKPDYSRDYYADLELPSTADATDVKKQFKKLALKWHPDRNPGKEDSAKDKFLVIQAAHEILTDPTAKAKYDAYRKRSNPYPTSSGVRGNPYQNVSQETANKYGAPPTRWPNMPTRPTPPTGASRYSNWGVPPQPKTKQADPHDNIRAWDRMRPSGNRSSTGAAPTASSTYRQQAKAAEPPPPPPRTAAQARRAEASFGTPRRAGFAPTSPMGDEPQVKNQHYNNTTRSHSNLFEEAANNLRNSRAEPFSVDPEINMESRQSTPYASGNGEKTNPFEGANVNRAKSVRESWREPQNSDDSEPTPPRPQRQRSASVGESDGLKKSTNENTPYGGTAGSHRFGFPSQASARYSPRPIDPKSAPSPAFAAPNGSTSSVDSTANATVNGGTPKKDGSNVYAPSPSYSATKFRSSSAFPQSIPHVPKPSGHAGEGYNPRPQESSYSQNFEWRTGGETPSGELKPRLGLNAFERGLDAQLQHLLGKMKSPYKLHANESEILSPKKSGHRVSKRANTAHHPSFSIPVDETTFQATTPNQQARFMRNSTENINTRFSPGRGADSGYQFNAGGKSPADDPFLRAKQRSRSAPRGRQSPLKTGVESSTEPSTTNPQQNGPEQKQSGFDAEQWTEKIGPHNFVPPPVVRQSSSPTRSSRPTKKPKPVRMTAGTAGLVDDEETTSGEEKVQPAPAPAPAPAPVPAPVRAPAPAPVNMDGARSPNAMDIDTPPPEPIIPPIKNARTINVEPSKPEWRAGDLNGGPPDAKLGNGLNMPKPNPNTTGSEDTDDLSSRPIFSEFKNVEPFAPKPVGLSSFGDLRSNLPFESQPSAKLPILKEKPKSRLEFPAAPVPPQTPPVLAIPHLKPNAITWIKYIHDFETYLKAWAAFDKMVVDHFVARHRVGEAAGDKRFAWVNTTGDTGIEQYLRWMEEDKSVRQNWMAACEIHEQRVKEFMRHRVRMRQ